MYARDEDEINDAEQVELPEDEERAIKKIRSLTSIFIRNKDYGVPFTLQVVLDEVLEARKSYGPAKTMSEEHIIELVAETFGNLKNTCIDAQNAEYLLPLEHGYVIRQNVQEHRNLIESITGSLTNEQYKAYVASTRDTK